jgi:hypothetical protein
VQYSCQQNFTVLASDGYWNSTDDKGATPNAATNFGPYALDNLTMVGNMDGLGTLPPMFEGNYPNGVTVPNSLADVAMYYYQTDLRRPDPVSNTCTSGSTGANLCPVDSNGQYAPNVPTTATDDNPKPHMTTLPPGDQWFAGLLGQLCDRHHGDFDAIKRRNELARRPHDDHFSVRRHQETGHRAGRSTWAYRGQWARHLLQREGSPRWSRP